MQRNAAHCVFQYVMYRKQVGRTLLAAVFALSGARSQIQTPASQPQTVTTKPVIAPATPIGNEAKVTITAMQPWTDTGIDLRRGDTVQFAASGTIAFAGGRTVPADGVLRGWKDMLRMFPVDAAPAGALVGRIGEDEAAVPFVIGQATSLTATRAGKLYVRCNTSGEAPATGSFKLTVKVKRAEIPGVTPSISPGLLVPASRLNGLPRRVSDAESHPGDVLNFVLIGTEDQVRTALQNAGWVAVDADVQSAVLHGLLSTLEHKPYLEVPMSPLYLFGRVQDLSYARASAIKVARERHHLRCWKTGILQNGIPLWVGSATHDIGFERDQRNGKITHSIAPEIDAERDFLRDTLTGTGATSDAAYFTPKNAIREGQTATGGSFVTDGRVLVLQLR